MHPDISQLAAYLDQAVDQQKRTELREHTLTCPICAAELAQLRADAQRITSISSTVPAPDVRAEVRARLHRRKVNVWPIPRGVFVVILVVMLFFALIVGKQDGETAGFVADRLFVVDQRQGQLIEIDPADGQRLASISIGNQPSAIRYDWRQDRLYILLAQAVVAVDPQNLSITSQWNAPYQFKPNAGMIWDDRRARLYIAQPGGVAVLNTPTLSTVSVISTDMNPGPLALSPDGHKLFTIDQDEHIFWVIDITTGAGRAVLLHFTDIGPQGWMVPSSDDQGIFLLRGGSMPLLQRYNLQNRQVERITKLADGPPPRDLLLLQDGHLAIARGDGRAGGVEIMETRSLSMTTWLESSYDQHHLVGGSGQRFFALNWSGTVTEYDISSQSVIWRIKLENALPSDGVFVRGGWRWSM